MTMKSKSAVEWMERRMPLNIGSSDRRNIWAFGELIEQDLRDRAVRAFCAQCPMSEQPPCMCPRKTDFLKHYDEQ
jgi:hypothetical protein